MCRIAGYLGAPTELSGLVDRPSHSLYHQSYAAKELETSVVSADGWGAAWYLPNDAKPCVYRTTLPIWGDANRADLGRATRSHCLLAAVRSATDPISIAPLNTQPFRRDRLCFVHNGYVDDFRSRLRKDVVERLSNDVYGQVCGDTDSEHLFALLSQHWLDLPDAEPGERLLLALRAALEVIKSLAESASLKALLTVVASDGRSLIAARTAQNAKSPSLYVRHRVASRQTWFASEPLDADSDWEAMEEGVLVLARSDGRLERRALG